MNKLSEKEIEAIRNRAEKATEGPWDFVPYAEGNELAVITQDLEEIISEEVFEWEDATFIAHAREDIPKLLAEIGRYRETINNVLNQIEELTFVRGEPLYYAYYELLEAIKNDKRN